MSPLAEVSLVTTRELRRSFRSVKGVALAALTFAGGAGAAMLFAWADRVRREHMPDGVDPAELSKATQGLQHLQQRWFSAIYGDDTGAALADCPYPLWVMLMATLWLGPILIALMGSDAVSGDLQHRTVRFWVVRSRRSSYIVGKHLGGWLAVLAVILAMNAIVWTVTVAVGRFPVGVVLAWGVRFFAVSIPITAAWCGVGTLVGSQLRTPILALLLTCAAFFGLWLLPIVAGWKRLPWLLYVYPSSYDRLFLSPHPADIARGLLGTGAIALLTATAAALLFDRRDV